MTEDSAIVEFLPPCAVVSPAALAARYMDAATRAERRGQVEDAADFRSFAAELRAELKQIEKETTP